MADGEFERGGDAVQAAGFVIGRHEGGDVAHGEQFAGGGVEDHGGVGAAVGAGDDHGRRLLSVAQAAEEVTGLAIAIGAETAIAVDQILGVVCEFDHRGVSLAKIGGGGKHSRSPGD